MAQTELRKSSMAFDIPIDKIDQPYGIRHYYDEEQMRDLSNSIGNDGIIQPVLVVESTKPGRYNLVVGSRRLKATMAKGITTILGMLLKDLSTAQIKILAFQENIHRADLTPFEEAWAVFDLVKNEKLGIQGTAKALKKNESWVRKNLKYLSVPNEVKSMVLARQLSFGDVEVLVSMVTDVTEQIKFAKEAVFHHFSPEELRQYILDHPSVTATTKSGQKSEDNTDDQVKPGGKFRPRQGSSESRMLAVTKTMTAQKLIMRLRLAKRMTRAIFRTLASRPADDIVNILVEMKSLRDDLNKNIKKMEEEYNYLLPIV